MTNKNIEKEEKLAKMREDILHIRSRALQYYPHIGRLLYSVNIAASDKIKKALYSNTGTIYFNPDYFNKGDINFKFYLLMHEVLHGYLDDITRGNRLIPQVDPQTRKKLHELWNIVADVYNDYLLTVDNKYKDYEIRQYDIITFEKLAKYLNSKGINITVKQLRSMTKEELFNRILRELQRVGGTGGGIGGITGDIDDFISSFRKDPQGDINPTTIPDDLEGDIIVEGPPILQDNKDPETVRRVFADTVKSLPGTETSAIVRALKEYYEGKIPWSMLLINLMKEAGFGRVLTDWKRPSRRFPSLPGYKMLKPPNAWILIDTSGSISDDELKKFIGEVYKLMKDVGNKVTVVEWDTQVKGVWELTSPSDVKRIKFAYEGGGTEIAEALRYVNPKFEYDEIIVIFTDGDILDIDDNEVRFMLSRLASMSSLAVWATTDKEIDVTSWINLRIY